MVRLLMERGADARIGIYPHRDATSALTLAIERGYDEIVEVIHGLEHSSKMPAAPANAAARMPFYTPLHEAIERGDDSRVLALLQATHESHNDRDPV